MADSRPLNSRISSEVVTDEVRLDMLAPEWNALNSKCGADGFFTQFRVIKANWARYRDDPRTSLHVFTVRDGGKLVFAAPMVKRRDLMGTHKLHWLDSKTPLYDDVLLDPDADLEIMAHQLGGHLASSWTRRALSIDFALEGTALWRILNAINVPRHKVSVAYSLDIAAFDTWEQFLAGRSAKSRRNYRNLGRNMRKAGARPAQLITDPQERRAEIASLFAHKRHWARERTDREGWIGLPETEAWFQDVADQGDARNQAHLLVYRSDTEWIASALSFERDGTLFASKMVYNQNWSRYSPGWLLIFDTIGFAIERKLQCVDLMMGESAWKDRMCDRTRTVYRCRADLLPWQRGWMNPKTR